MFEVVVLGAIAVVGLGLAFSLLSLVMWMFFLPFKLMALSFKLMAAVLALPFLLIIGAFGAAVFGAGVVIFLLPAILPFAFLILGICWLVRRNRANANAAA